jgi:hypothetical protein
VENTAATDDQVTLRLFSDSGTYNKIYSVPQGGLLEISVKDLQRNAVPDEKGQLLSGAYGVFSISGSHGAQSKLTFGKIIYSSDEADYVGDPVNSCDYVLGIGLSITFAGANPLPLVATWDWSLSGDDQQAAFGSTINASYITINHNANGDTATVNFANAVPGQSLFLNGPATGATTCDACSASDIYPAGSQQMPVMARIHQGSCSGTDITGTTQSIVVGQQIALCATYNLPSGASMSSQSWGSGDGNGASSVGGFTASNAGDDVVTQVSNNQSTILYFFKPGNGSSVIPYSVVFTNSTSALASVTYNIAGVTSPSMTVTSPNGGLLSVDSLAGCPGTGAEQALVYGNISGAVPPCPAGLKGAAGIVFTPQGTQPTGGGAFSFVQLINSDTTTYSETAGTETCTHNPDLDTGYPYPLNASGQATDSPLYALPSTYTSTSRSFNATMYLMWTPNPASGCPNGSACTIPVPLGYQNRQFSGSATQPQSNSTWGNPMGSGGPSGSFVTSPLEYPFWTGVSTVTCN